MSAPAPTIYLIAGCNGAGKTTFAREFLPHEAKCLNFLNADLIAQGISPFDLRSGATRAARVLLTEFRSLIERRETFALESTLSGQTYIRLFQHAKSVGYRIDLHYLWLPSTALAITRVRNRVQSCAAGGPSRAKDIRRRFQRSLVHFASDYAPLADRWALWDNQTSPPRLLADSRTCPNDKLQTILSLP